MENHYLLLSGGLILCAHSLMSVCVCEVIRGTNGYLLVLSLRWLIIIGQDLGYQLIRPWAHLGYIRKSNLLRGGVGG